jgi:(S)-2-hydroxyglutarate dehydrogenase
LSTPYEIVIVGAGIVGLATARELRERHPGLRLAVVDKEPSPGRHQSGHNSGVLHAGVYYKPGSLKAQLCVEGKALLERFAEEHQIPYRTCGKLIVALNEGELGRLADLGSRGRANGVPGLRMIGRAEMAEIEPHAAGLRALHVPGTGIIDFGAVVRMLHSLLADAGVDFYLGHELVGITRTSGVTVLRTSVGEICTRRLITCAGLQSDRVARLEPDLEAVLTPGGTTPPRPPGADPGVQIVPFRGDYYTLKPEARHLCRALIYPVPDPALPFLGVHFTKRIDGEVWAGPNAVLALAREGYRRSQVKPADVAETLRYKGFRRLAKRYWRTGAAEVWRDIVKRAFVKELQRYVPAVESKHLVFGPSGVRAQAVAADGGMVDDFKLATSATSVHVLNAPSPAATAALAIARRLSDQAEDAFHMTSAGRPHLLTPPAPDKAGFDR